MAIFSFKSKNDEVLEHWISFADGFNMPSQEFYEAIEKELTARKIPSMNISRVDYAEGGLLSEKRVYLRLIRERLAFDLCGAQFGTGYFFSCRTVHSPPAVRLWHIVAVTLFFTGIYFLLLKYLGFVYAIIALLALFLAIIETFRNTVALGLSDLDNMLMKIPAFGPIYEQWFRKETYYRLDTRLVYLKIVPEIVKSVAENATGAKGIKLEQQYECAPIFGELYKRVPPRKTEPEK